MLQIMPVETKGGLVIFKKKKKVIWEVQGTAFQQLSVDDRSVCLEPSSQ